MKFKAKFLTFTVTALLLLTGIAFAQGPGGWGGPGYGRGHGHGYGYGPDMTNLTAQQQEEIRQLIQQQREKMYELRTQSYQIRTQLDAELMQDNPNSDKINSLTDQLADIASKRINMRTEMQQKLFKDFGIKSGPGGYGCGGRGYGRGRGYGGGRGWHGGPGYGRGGW